MVYQQGTPAEEESLTSHLGKSVEAYATGVSSFIGSEKGQETIANVVKLAAI